MSARLVSVNVGMPQLIARTKRGEEVWSGIVKGPVAGRVDVAGVNVAGDGQADLTVHGGPDKAIYAYAAEDNQFWEDVLGRDVPAGFVGENLTTTGLDVTGAVIGEHWVVGTVELEVCQPRLPCFKLGARFGDAKMVKRFGDANRPGAYLRIVREGELGAGDAIEVRDRPEHGVTVADVADAVLHDKTRAAEVLRAPQLAEMLAEPLRRLAGA